MENSKRNIALDIFRGFLVLGMIVFHARLHLFASEIPEVVLYFIPTGFVLFAGILVGAILGKRKSTHQLVARGAKLILLFLILNFPFWWADRMSIIEMISLLIIGNPEYSAFEILVPIGLTIIVAPFLLRFKKPLLFFGITFALLVLLDVNQFFPFTLKFFLVGLQGVFLGQHSLRNMFLSLENNATTIALSVVFSIILIFLFFVFKSSWSLQVLFTLTLSIWIPPLIYSIPKGSVGLEVLGQYSLILYFFHVIIIKIFSQFEFFITNSFFFLGLEIILVTLLCFLFLELLLLLKWKFPFLRKTYELAFK